MRKHWPIGICIVALAAVTSSAEVIENGYLHAEVNPQGGVVTRMSYRPATTFPLIADKGAGVAGTGRFLVLRARVGETDLDLSQVAMQPASKGKGDALVLTAHLPEPGSKITWTRTFCLAPTESGFRVTDSFRNDGDQNQQLVLTAQCVLRREPWRANLRCWFGDQTQSTYRVAPPQAGAIDHEVTHQDRVFWRVLSQYDIGLLVVADLPGGGEYTHALPPVQNAPASFEWTTRPLELAKGKTVSLTSAWMIDEGDHGSNNPQGLVDSDRTTAGVDLRAAGMPGDVIPAAVTVASAVARKVKVDLIQYRDEGGRRVDSKAIAHFDDALVPGEAVHHALDVTADQKGLLGVEAVVTDASGRKLITTGRRSLIDGSDAQGDLARVWEAYRAKMPETVRKGTWEQIGAAGLSGEKVNPEAGARERAYFAFLKKKYPYYGRMLEGAAAARKIEPFQLLKVNAPAAGGDEACMNVVFNGPDGPLNCFSKERSGPGQAGLNYQKIIPDAGYRFQVYMGGYGVNSAGLSMSGASLNCDEKTHQVTDQRLGEWLGQGKYIAPPLWQWVMFATCKTVDEAIAFMTDPEIPIAGEAQFTLVDRDGHAAHIEGWGVTHHVDRYDAKSGKFFVVGNYPVETPDGLFKIGGWAWAANTMMRERRLAASGLSPTHISLRDAFRLMEAHGSGGMCQHLYDNTGSLFSNCSFIAVPRTGDLYLAYGPPCRVHYQKYTLADE